VLHGRHQLRVARIERGVVGEGDGIDARAQRRIVGDALHAAAVHVDHGPEAAQRLAVVGTGHQPGLGSGGIHRGLSWRVARKNNSGGKCRADCADCAGCTGGTVRTGCTAAARLHAA
jgi:hypothetical protein